jgi:prenylcysteine oxidase/farnesylcysteine lyase
MRYTTLLLLLPGVIAFEVPFSGTKSFKYKTSVPGIERAESSGPSPGKPRVAIIGAGAGGTAAAFWISKAKERFDIDVDVDVYEKNEYIGGRRSGRSAKPYPTNKCLQAAQLYTLMKILAYRN